MFKKIYNLFKILRKLSISGSIETLEEIKPLPKSLKIVFFLFSFGGSKKIENLKKTSGEKLCQSLEEMGTTFIKLGQFLATRPDIIGEEIAKKLERLQDRLPAFSIEKAKIILEREIGSKSYKDILFLSEPVAAASIAQVHFAKLKTQEGERQIAIKILRPNIHSLVNEELDALMFLAYLIESIFAKTKRLKLVEVINLLKEITNVEMDLRFEAAAASELRENTINDKGLKVPKIYWNYTSKEVLALDKVDGISIRETEKLKNLNIDLKILSRNLIQTFLKQSVRDGFFHADMHQGNIFIDDNSQIIPIDFGIMGRLDKLNKRFLAEILFGFIKRDYKKVAEVHLLAGLVPKNVPMDDLAQALRSIGEPIFGHSVKDISGGKLLKQLFEITEKFNMQTQPQLLLLQKTMVVVEGVARKLNPNTNIWETSKPVLENWLKESKDPFNSLNDKLKDTTEAIKKLPEFPELIDKANQALSFLASGQIPETSNSYLALIEKKSEIVAFRNQTIIGLLLLVIFGLLVF